MEKENSGGGEISKQTNKQKEQRERMELFTRGSPVEKLLNPIA